MSKNIIVDYLLHGELDLKMSRATDESVRLIGIVSDAYDALLAVLTDEQKALLEKFKSALEDHQCEEVDHFFAEGFKAGVLMGLEMKK